MLSLELSTIDILLIAAVVTLFILFVTVLMKLSPSTETKEKLQTGIQIENEVEAEKHKPLQTSPQIVPQNHSLTKINSTQRVAQKIPVAVAPQIGGSSTQSGQEALIPTSTFNQPKEIPKPEKTVPPIKPESTSSKRDCLHHFGYLRTLPKNAPIPDECFGCQKIVECLVQSKIRQE